jgi:hypothetical protein
MATNVHARQSGLAGPLSVSRTNPRYFTLPSEGREEERAVYLTGSHIWNNLQDGMGPGGECAKEPEPFDYDGYLAFLAERGHNFIRLWRWEQFRSQAAGGQFHLCMEPQPWKRTGPGAAKDGKRKFDLSTFDPTFFHRLRQRVNAAAERGIYVAVMLFDGWGLHLSPAPDHVEGHPFHATNNVNGVGIRSIEDYQVLPLTEDIAAYQEAYIHEVVDVLHDLPNVIWEVANESCGGGSVDESFTKMLGLDRIPDWGDSTEWQYWVIDVVERHEVDRGYDVHPIGMTMQFPVPDQTKVNDPLLASRAQWISPGYDDAVFAEGGHPMAPGSPPSRWYDDPPAADGGKVVITDTDHYAPGKGDALWAWKSFLRGHHPILMDFGVIGGFEPSAETPGVPPFDAFEPVRWAMGDTRRYAERVDLIAMEPRGDLSSTGYALASEGREYLVLHPGQPRDTFDVRLAPGAYEVEWYSVTSRETRSEPVIEVATEQTIRVGAPFDGATVLYLRSKATS